MERDTYTATIELESYIADPFWTATSDLINIKKLSGESRQKSDDKRKLAIKGHLTKIGMTEEEYEALQRLAELEWYRIEPTDPNSPIIIPRHHMAGCLVETIGRSPKSIRGPYNKDSFRHHVRITDFVTTKLKADSVYDRYVKLETSNQRKRQKHQVIENFQAVGTISIAKDTKTDALEHLISFALEETGLGASRKMGYGRGKLVSFELTK